MVGLIAGAVIGGGLSLTSSILSSNSQKKALRKQRAQIEELRDTYLQNLDTQFKLETAEANNQADEADLTTDLNESQTSTSFDNSIENIAQQQEADTLSYNQQAISAGQSTGNELSAMSQSGTRSSSMAQAIDQEAAMNTQQLQMSEDSQRQSEKSAISQAVLQLASSTNSIQSARTSADTLRNSYADGGSQYINYQQTRDYNELQYNNQIDAINDQIDDLNWFNGGSFNWGKLLNVSASTISGAASGASTGFKLANYISSVKKD